MATHHREHLFEGFEILGRGLDAFLTRTLQPGGDWTTLLAAHDLARAAERTAAAGATARQKPRKYSRCDPHCGLRLLTEAVAAPDGPTNAILTARDRSLARELRRSRDEWAHLVRPLSPETAAAVLAKIQRLLKVVDQPDEAEQVSRCRQVLRSERRASRIEAALSPHPSSPETSGTVSAPTCDADGHHDGAHLDEALHSKARDGDGQAVYQSGDELAQQADQVPAEDLYRQAANRGDAVAMCQLAALLAHRGDRADAEHWYRRSAEAHNSEAMYQLGLLQLAAPADRKAAEDWFRRAAAAQHHQATYQLGALLAQRGDLTGAENRFRQAADAGSSAARYRLGVILAERGDLIGAQRCYRRAVAAIQNAVATGPAPPQPDESEYRAAADGGDRHAMTRLGELLTVSDNGAEAEQWLGKAAELGDPEAMRLLGARHLQRGEPEQAEEWLCRAAVGEDVEAMTLLGTLLWDTGNVDEGQSWTLKAADADNTAAMTKLGHMLARRGEVDSAQTWWHTAAAKGSAEAISALADMLNRPAGAADANGSSGTGQQKCSAP